MTIMYLSGDCQYRVGHYVERLRTKLELDDAENSSNAGNSLGSQKSAIIQSQITRRTFHNKRRRGRRGWGREGVVGGRGVDVDVSEGKETGHGGPGFSGPVKSENGKFRLIS